MSVDPVLRFRCPHCLREYSRRDDAAACARRGPPTPLPTGLIFQARHASEGHSPDVYYAIAEGHQRPGTRFHGSHDFDYSLWVARDTGRPDRMGGETVGGYAIAPRSDAHIPDSNHPAFWRLVCWLDAQGIDVTVWDGSRAVPFSRNRDR